MLRAGFERGRDGLVLRLDGELVTGWAAQVKCSVSRHFVRNGLLVDVSDVTRIDCFGERLLLWLRDLQSKFVAQKTCYAREVCERLCLEVVADVDERVSATAEVRPS